MIAALILLLVLGTQDSCAFDDLPCRMGRLETEAATHLSRQEFQNARVASYEVDGDLAKQDDRQETLAIIGLVVMILGKDYLAQFLRRALEGALKRET